MSSSQGHAYSHAQYKPYEVRGRIRVGLNAIG